jgi:hypothetical protein
MVVRKLGDIVYFPSGGTARHQTNADPSYLNPLVKGLVTGNFREQFQAIEQIKLSSHPKAATALQRYILDQNPDPVLKTIALQALKEMGVSGKVRIVKFGKAYDVLIDNVPSSEDEFPPDVWKVMELVSAQTLNDNPSFPSFAAPLWMEFLFASYPVIPNLSPLEGWAAAIHYLTSKYFTENKPRKEIANQYGVSVSILSSRYKQIYDRLYLGRKK